MDSDGVEPPKTIQDDRKMIQKSMDSDGMELPNRVQNIKKTSKSIFLDSISILKNALSGRKLTRRPFWSAPRKIKNPLTDGSALKNSKKRQKILSSIVSAEKT